jgi:hypothetical protein
MAAPPLLDDAEAGLHTRRPPRLAALKVSTNVYHDESPFSETARPDTSRLVGWLGFIKCARTDRRRR